MSLSTVNKAIWQHLWGLERWSLHVLSKYTDKVTFGHVLGFFEYALQVRSSSTGFKYLTCVLRALKLHIIKWKFNIRQSISWISLKTCFNLSSLWQSFYINGWTRKGFQVLLKKEADRAPSQSTNKIHKLHKYV